MSVIRLSALSQWRRGVRVAPSLPTAWTPRRFYQSEQLGVFGNNPQAWRKFRQELEEVTPVNYEARVTNAHLYQYISAFRTHGHKYASTNPVPFKEQSKPSEAAELSPTRYGLSENDSGLDASELLKFSAQAQQGMDRISLGDLTDKLLKTYCGSVSVEFDQVESDSERAWLWERHECLSSTPLTPEQKRSLASEMLRSQNFDNFMAVKFSNVKRYGGEGAEAMMGIFTQLVQGAGEHDIKEYVIGMPHRGRLNLMTGILKYPPVLFFRKMSGLPEFSDAHKGAGDVLSHLTSSVDLPTGADENSPSVHVTMLPNPSHLEAVNPVACGKVRARHMTQSTGDYGKGLLGKNIVCVQVHGDAALSAQGINQETLQLSQVPHFAVGGSLHFVVNNQVGFTTPGDRGRTSRYCTDLAKQIGAPVIHVNGDCPEDVVRATQLALEYQQRYRRDVFVDLICYRRHGHNELDDPTFTNPMLYKTIHKTRTLPDVYAEQLVSEGLFSPSDVSALLEEHNAYLSDNFKQVETAQDINVDTLKGQWSDMRQASNAITQWDTGVPIDTLKFIGAKSVEFPKEFNVHPHLSKHHVASRLKRLESGSSLDWGGAESLALGSLLYQGYNVRISGQDVGRATFAHRHAMLVDQETNEIYVPLNHMMDGEKAGPSTPGHLELANSPLSEEAVLGFEYGMSVESPRNLIIWEAQFGDFFNGAQIILDTYVGSGESKWGLQSSLVLLLPHGMDGAGPEHSSCRMERFLQMSDSSEAAVDSDHVNWNVVCPTTAAQYFHLLRRQMIRDFRKPLVVVGPKVLLRLGDAASSLAEMSPGQSFQPVLGHPQHKLSVEAKQVKRVVFCAGKHHYALLKHAVENGIKDTAFVRVEQLCPFPTKELQDQVSNYPNAKAYIWSQEEQRNMGAWTFVAPRFANLVGVHLQYVGRPELCQPAVGVGQAHQKEVKEIIQNTFV